MAASNDTELGKKIWHMIKGNLLGDAALSSVFAYIQSLDLSDELADWLMAERIGIKSEPGVAAQPPAMSGPEVWI